MNHIWAIREITRGTYKISFQKHFRKPPDWRLNKGVVSGTLQAVLTLNRQRWGWCYKPHRSKVKGANKANLFRIKVRTLGCALCISQECDIVATPDQQPKSKTLLGTSKGLAWGSCWRCLSAIFTRQLYSIIKENYMPYSHICITNLAPQLFSSFVHLNEQDRNKTKTSSRRHITTQNIASGITPLQRGPTCQRKRGLHARCTRG